MKYVLYVFITLMCYRTDDDVDCSVVPNDEDTQTGMVIIHYLCVHRVPQKRVQLV